MRYLNQSEILPIINSGKEVEQFLGEFFTNNFRCFRYVTIGKTKEGYFALIFEKFDDSDEGLTSVYDYSSVEPDDLYGKEVGPFESFEEIIEKLNEEVHLDSEKYLLSGYLDEEIKTEPNKT